jgi:hypothetical protein
MSANVKDPVVTNFVSGTAVNMRRSVGISKYEMGEFASGCYIKHPVSTKSAAGPLSQDEWAAARAITHSLATAATRLRDQPIGLLRYAPSIRSWTLGKVGQKRDCSWELSNVGSWDPQDTPKGGISSSYNITKYIFAQPSHVDQAPMCLNVVSVAGGGLACTVTWQHGASGVDGDEGAFIDNVCKSFKDGFEGL